MREAADMFGAANWITGSKDVQALYDEVAVRRVADWVEKTGAGGIPDNDPFFVERERGDPVERGVQIGIAVFLRERFGAELHRTAAVLTAIALGLEVIPSEQISRSAFNRTQKGPA